MKQRCLNPKNPNYERYGGRGITVCERWMKFDNFLADIGIAPEGLTIERKNNDGGYSLENCIWETFEEQAWNTRHNRVVVVDGVQMKTRDLAAMIGDTHQNVLTKLATDWTVEQIMAGYRERKKRELERGERLTKPPTGKDRTELVIEMRNAGKRMRVIAETLGLTRQRVDQILKAASGRCIICGQPKVNATHCQKHRVMASVARREAWLSIHPDARQNTGAIYNLQARTLPAWGLQ